MRRAHDSPSIEVFNDFVTKHGFPEVDSWARSAEGGLPVDLENYEVTRPLLIDELDEADDEASATVSGTS